MKSLLTWLPTHQISHFHIWCVNNSIIYLAYEQIYGKSLLNKPYTYTQQKISWQPTLVQAKLEITNLLFNENLHISCKYKHSMLIEAIVPNISSHIPHKPSPDWRPTFSLTSSITCFLALSRSSCGPRSVTLSLLLPSGGKRMITPPHSSMIARISLPLAPMMELCILWGISMVISLMLAYNEITFLFTRFIFFLVQLCKEYGHPHSTDDIVTPRPLIKLS